MEITVKSAKETEKSGFIFAKELKNRPLSNGAFVIALCGDLGSGKTTFTQGFAKGLGIKENVLSPTFVIQKDFRLNLSNYKNFYHIDAYRLKNPQELLELGFEDLIREPSNLIVIEWADRIKHLLPKGILWIKFDHLNNKRRLKIFNF